MVVDGRWAQPRPRGGVGRGIAAVMPMLAEALPVTLLTDRRGAIADLGVEEIALATPPPGVAAGWLQWSAPRWLSRQPEGTVFWCPWYGLPYRQPVPMVVTIHDLTFEHRPEWFTRGQRSTYRAQARHAARTARSIFVPSQHVKDDVVNSYRVDPDRVILTPNAVDEVFTAQACTALALPDDYVVAIGGATRRRLDLAVAAWRAAGTSSALVVLGDGPPDTVSLRGISDSDWAGVLAGARALLYPTDYEGFGMPALEALACGTPVVAGRVGALPEVLGDSASWAEEHTPGAFAAALREVRWDAGAAARALAASSWSKTAEIVTTSALAAA